MSRYGAYCGRALRVSRTRLALSHRRRRARCADWAKGEWRRATAPRLSITIGETYLVPSFLQRPAYSPFNLCSLVFPLPRARPVHSVSASSVTPLAILIPLAVLPSQTLRPLPTSLRPQDAALPDVSVLVLLQARCDLIIIGMIAAQTRVSPHRRASGAGSRLPKPRRSPLSMNARLS